MPAPSPPGPGLHPRKSDRTRQAILAAARRHFTRFGYDRASVRGIAAEANIDPSMVIRYFGSKEGLFAAAMDVDMQLPDLVATPESRRGHVLVEHFVRRWDDRTSDDAIILLLRAAATHDSAAERMRSIFDRQLVTICTPVVPQGEAQRRAALIASQLLGLAFSRYVLHIPPLSDTTAEELADSVGPTLQRYLSDCLR